MDPFDEIFLNEIPKDHPRALVRARPVEQIQLFFAEPMSCVIISAPAIGEAYGQPRTTTRRQAMNEKYTG
jgi:hypothetical protein